MIHRLAVLFGLIVVGLVGAGEFPAGAATYQLNSGESIEGQPVSSNPQGVVIKKPDGNFAPRMGWTNFTQSALKQLRSDPKAKPYVEDLIEPEDVDPTGRAKKAELEIKPKIPDRLERPNPKAGFGALFSSTITLLGFILIYAANVYAGYEVGVFRNYHPGLTCGVAAVVPILGPIIFACLPTRIQKSHDELAAEAMAAHRAAQQAHEAALAAANAPSPEELVALEAAAAEAAAAAAAAAGPQIVAYTRGQTTFNRRFFETKFAGFLRMVPGEAERDKVIYIKSARGEHVGPRLSRIQPNELYLQIRDGGATADVMIPFNEIYEVQVRPVGA
ncbi:MAG TPA: hypothetical protein VFT34_17140 [Verrucomicrobiae bacterium]|nr:hypothetical protein [Verrucomicrobiae bacterium]